MVPTINEAFLNRWDPQYDSVETDQPKYDKILPLVREELNSLGKITSETFLRIIEWKAARVKGKLASNLEGYTGAIAATLHVPGIQDKLLVLVQLPGIGVPVASTILHFMHPALIPINDYRAVEVLNAAGLLNRLSRDEKRFPAFVAAIHSIRSQCPSFSLRQIDRALFAYHKLEFEPARTGKMPRLKCAANLT